MQRNGGVAYLTAGVLAVVGYFTVPGMRGNGLVFSLIGLSAAVAILVGALINRPKPLAPWILFAAAQVSFVVGDILYYAFDFEFPSIGDFFYLGVYPLLVAGLLILIRARTPGKDRASLLDASIITVGLGLLTWVFVIDPYTHLFGLSLAERVMSVAYPLMDVLLLAVAARLVMGSGTRSTSFYLIGLGIVSLLATDSVYGYIELHAGYTQGALLDAGWLAYYLLWGTAALLPGMRRLGEQSTESRPTLTGRRLVPLAAATLIAPGVGIAQSIQDADSAFSVSAAASAVLFLLVLARMTGLVRSLRQSVNDEQQALFREGVLRQAAAALGGVTDRAGIEDVTAEAARALTIDVIGVEVQVQLLAPRRRATDPPPPVPSPVAGGAAIEVPIATQASKLGVILVFGVTRLPAPILAALQALGAQAAVALARAALADDLLRRRSDERLAALAQHASDMITVLDADLVVQHQTASAQRFLKYEPGALVGHRLLDLVHPDDHRCAASFFYALAAERGVRPEVEFRFRRGDGTWLPVEAIGNNLLHDRLVQGIVVTLRDVSKRKALEDGLKRQVQELQQLDQIKTDLVSTVSHELRTPLTAMIGHVELLSQGELGELNVDQVWAVGAIERNSRRLLSLIEDLLTLSKIETGGFGLTMAPTDLRSLIEEIRTAMAPVAGEHSLEMTFEVGHDVDLMVADRSGLERALTNLLSNAVKFTPAGGKVSLSVARDGQSAVFTVSDTGIGMSAEDKDRLFTRFFRSPAAMSMAIPGTGLGLAIVKKIVDDHRGDINVDTSPGTGTTVTFTIPLVRMDRPVRSVAVTPG